MTETNWTPIQEHLARALADGLTEAQAAEAAGCSTKYAGGQVRHQVGFQDYVDALTIERVGAARAEALRIARRKLREVADEPSKKDVLDRVKLVWTLASGAEEDREMNERLEEWEAAVNLPSPPAERDADRGTY